VRRVLSIARFKFDMMCADLNTYYNGMDAGGSQGGPDGRRRFQSGFHTFMDARDDFNFLSSLP
jgi:hypothetical protein